MHEKTFLHPAHQRTPLGRRRFSRSQYLFLMTSARTYRRSCYSTMPGRRIFRRHNIGAGSARIRTGDLKRSRSSIAARSSIATPSGGGGTIGPGDVQWMTAASGLVHEEFHGADFAKRGGPFEMIQLWVNLAAKDKKAPPGYQNINDMDIPRVELPSGAGFVRVIAGNYQGERRVQRIPLVR